MTVSTLTNSVVYRGNGAATQFAVPFKVLDEDHLVVKRRIYATGVLDYTYVGTDYSYTGLGAASGTLTLAGTALDDDYELVIERIVPYTQDLDIVNAGGFYPDTVEEQLDLLTMGIQQVAGIASRSAIVPVGENGLALPKALERAGKYFAFDAEGDFTASAGTGGDSAFRTDAATSGGAALIGFLQAGSGALARSVQGRLRDTVHAFDFIPAAIHAAIEAGTDVTDLAAYLQAALNTGKLVQLPHKCLCWIASPLDVPSGGGIIGGGYGSLIKAKADFGNVPLIRNAVRYPPGANTAARLLNRDKGLYFSNFRVDGNKANNTTATEFSAAFWLAAVDGAHFENVWALNPKGDGLTILYATDGVGLDHAVGCSNITGFIRTENCARQGVAPVCAEGCDLSVYDLAAALFSLDPETDNALNYVRNNYFRLVSIGAGNGTVASGGIGVGGQDGDVHDNVIDFAIFNSAGSGVVWRNTTGLILRGTINGATLSGLKGIDTGAAPSVVNFDVDVRDVAGVGFDTNETAGSIYSGSVRISGGADAGGATITNAAGGRLHMRIEDHTGQGLILNNTTDMVFPDLFVGDGSSHSVWLLGATTGNRFPNLQTGTSQFGSGFLEAGTSNDNRATNARIGAAVTLIGAISFVEFETLKGSAVFDPGSIADGDMVQTTFTVTGATVGDVVEGSFSLALGGLALSFEISAANTVRATFLNNTGGAVDLGSGTLRAFVTPRV